MAITEYPAKADELAVLVNAERTARGLKPLYCVPYLNQVAMLRASEASTYWSHTRPNGEYFTSAIDTKKINFAAAGENLAATSETASGALEQWRNSANNWEKIVNKGYTHMGMGVVYNPSGVNNAGWYWCQIFLNGFSADDVFEGQYLPGVAEISYDTVTLAVRNTETGENIPDIPMFVGYRFSEDTKYDLSGIKITRNGADVPFTLSSDKGRAYFTSGVSDTEITNLPYGLQIFQAYHNKRYTADQGQLEYDDYLYAVLEIKNNGTAHEHIFGLKPIRLKILKTDKDSGEPLEGAVFQLTSLSNDTANPFDDVEISQDCTISDDFRTVTFTSLTAPIVFTKIPVNTYELLEITAPEGYIKTEKSVFRLDGSGNLSLTSANKGGVFEDGILKMPGKKREIHLFPISHSNTIRVYDITEKQEGFKSNGLAVLSPTSCESEKNGDVWDVELVHSIDEWGKWKCLAPQNILKIDGQLFRIDIQEAECSEDGNFITVHANHISYDMADDLIENAEFKGGNAQDFIDFCFQKAAVIWDEEEIAKHPEAYFQKPYVFTGMSDIDTVLGGDKYVNTTLWGAIAGVDNCLLNRYGGEIYRDNFYFSVNRRMENARDNAFFLRYGMNVSGIKQRVDFTDFRTYFSCADNYDGYWAVSYSGEVRDFIHHVRRSYAKFNYDNAETADKMLATDGQALWNMMNTPKVTYTINVNSLKTDPRYSDFQKLLECDYGDTGTIYCPELDISTVQKIVDIRRDHLTGEIISLELGNVAETILRPKFLGSTVTNGRSIWDKI
ncbi:MAG: CAP domain-containing protein [Ruminococcus flavefaciens]|nr:CAP domain-containing protein [Ruminococcus flavefaciens]MCM1232668.1 CAP domain-containing protein [Ruminococcus flavefaciens]